MTDKEILAKMEQLDKNIALNLKLISYRLHSYHDFFAFQQQRVIALEKELGLEIEFSSETIKYRKTKESKNNDQG